jgi:hypothetical protein
LVKPWSRETPDFIVVSGDHNQKMRGSSTLPCYLVEWYSSGLADDSLSEFDARLDECTASMRAEGRTIQLLMTLAVPTDEVVYGVFGAASAGLVAQACQRAGHPAERLTAAMDVTGRVSLAVGAYSTHES